MRPPGMPLAKPSVPADYLELGMNGNEIDTILKKLKAHRNYTQALLLAVLAFCAGAVAFSF